MSDPRACPSCDVTPTGKVPALHRGGARARFAQRLGGALFCALIIAGPVQAQAPNVGSVIANPAVVGQMFANVCVGADNAQGVEAALRGVGMLDNPETGTFFHQLFDLSLNPTGGGCSMVFVIDQDEATATAQFRAAVTRTHGAEVPDLRVSARESDGTIYMRARVEVSW